jgi:hypothetical protein
VPQLVVIVQILVAERTGEDALCQHLSKPMLDPIRPPLVGKQAATRSMRPSLRSTWRSNSEPPSLDTWPAVKPASTRVRR